MAFNIPNQTSYVLQRPVNPYSAWTRQADWITITDTAGEVQFLTSNLAGSAYTITTTFTQTGGIGNIYIDWGDGTTDTISTIAATSTSHTYTTSGTPCSLGYDTYKVRVYGDAGTRITQARMGIAHPIQLTFGVLEAYYGDNTILTAKDLFSNNINNSAGRYPLLEYVKLPSVMFGGGALTLQASFFGCPSLAKVIMPVSCSNATDFTYTFISCPNLQEITLPTTVGASISMASTFSGCRNLSKVTIPSGWNLTSLQNTFNTCVSLNQVILPNNAQDNLTTINGMCNGCFNLKSIVMPNIVKYL